MQTVMFGDGGFRQFRESAFFRMAADKFRFAAVFENLVLQFKFQQFAGKGGRGGQADGKGVSAVSSVLRNVGFFSAVSATGSAKLSAISSGRHDSLQAV